MTPISDIRDQVGESPVWSVAEQALWWVDIDGCALRRFDPASGEVRSWPTAQRTGCIALHGQGGLLAAMETGLFHVQPQADGTLASQPLATVPHARDGMRFNDGRTDRAGRFWAGTMVRDMSLASDAGALYRYDRRGLVKVLDGFITPNGLGFSPDNRTMYVSDSHPSVQKVWAFDLSEDGTPSNRREFIDMNAYPGRPDGAAVDAEGAYWICANDAGLVHRFLPDGRLDRSIEVPAAKPAMCAFGGPDLQTLFVTSIRPGTAPAGISAEAYALAGALFTQRTGTRGLPEATFQA
ncbi:SMP-30/gluconolactonase/LRE family protein [Aquincola sp. MAHUQ-54]|uniref:SMP-30/gluconolactonase/LRE family protein n=1 Tax=Aquincola agrisoli TaxID=3119538 RepID=A0AAW9Q4T6_9BURK